MMKWANSGKQDIISTGRLEQQRIRISRPIEIGAGAGDWEAQRDFDVSE